MNSCLKCAISEDGINFTEEPGVRLSGTAIPDDPEWQVHGATVIELDDGSYRMYYIGATGEGGPGHAIHRIYSAISSDGLNFTREGIRIESEGTIDNGWASVKRCLAFLLPITQNGQPWRLVGFGA